MKKRILAILLAVATLSSLAALYSNAVPYSPPTPALKEFGQQHLYIYETEGKTPRMDGLVTESDGYGEPVATYNMRYTTTAEKVVMQEDGLTPRPEYQMVDSGDRSGEYNVFPTTSSPDEVWKSISKVETDSPYAFPYAWYYTPSTFSATSTYYYYNPESQTYSTARFVTAENFNDYEAVNSTTVKYHVRDWALLTEKPADWETGFRHYFTTVGGAYSKVSSETAWKEGAYFAKEGTSYVITRAEPADWAENYASYYSRGEVLWVPLTGDRAPAWEEGKYYSGTAFQDKTYVVQNVKVLYEKPADWDTKWKSYYYKSTSTGTAYYNLSDKTAPEFVPGIYFSGTKLKSKLFLSGEGSTGGVPAISVLRNNHVILPESVNLYVRYDNKCLYVAIELVEMAHKTARYDDSVRFCSTINQNQGVSFANHSFGCYYRKNLDGTAPFVVRDTSGTRSYFRTSINLSDAGYKMILNKYGNPDATAITDVLTPGTWFNVKHYSKEQMDAILGKDQPAEQPSEQSDDWSMEEDSSAATEDRYAFNKSGTYGTTVYEYKQLWTVINDKYNGSGSSIPEVFGLWNEINLDNTLGSGAFKLAIELPRDTRHLLGSLSRSSNGNYPIETYAMRFVSREGLTKGASFGTARFQWASISTGYNPLNRDYVLTDYDGISQKKTLSSAHILPLLFPSGKQPDEKYGMPSLQGAQVRTDGEEAQGMRFLIDIPNSGEDIREAGVLIAPTEATVKRQLKLGMDEIRYNNVEFATFYGFDTETRTFVNLTEDPAKYYASNATPVYDTSFVTDDNVGGLPSAIYHVQDLKLDLDDVYKSGTKANTYTVEFNGLLDEDGTYNDWFTFYTIRPYVVYEDGTVIYGEHAYRSVYYVMCWTIQSLVTSYNTSQSLSTAATRFTMDQMARTAMKYANGNTVTDGAGETVYTDLETTPSTQSPYFGSVNFSLHETTGEARLEVFRAYATSLFNRANKGYSLRAKEYDSFTDEQKEIIDGYVERFENIWQCILKCEAKTYYYEK